MPHNRDGIEQGCKATQPCRPPLISILDRSIRVHSMLRWATDEDLHVPARFVFPDYREGMDCPYPWYPWMQIYPYFGGTSRYTRIREIIVIRLSIFTSMFTAVLWNQNWNTHAIRILVLGIVLQGWCWDILELPLVQWAPSPVEAVQLLTDPDGTFERNHWVSR